jgi:hypothetical protein
MDDDPGGFALVEYITPRSGLQRTAVSNTVPKAGKEFGGMLQEVKARAKVPGPEHYNKNFLDKSFAGKALGGTFTKLAREMGVKAPKTPSVGHYNTDPAERKVQGGIMCKSDRNCYFIDTAIRQGKNNPAPGKYDGVSPRPHTSTTKWDVSKTESRKTDAMRAQKVGPGHYTLNYAPTERHQPIYSAPKDPSRSFLDSHLKHKDSIPAPGTHSVQATKVEDRSGRRKHMSKLLADRIVTPRKVSTAPSVTMASGL